PVREEAAVLVELGDAVVRADAVGAVDVALAIPGDIGRTAERRPGCAGARIAAAAASAATFTTTSSGSTATFIPTSAFTSRRGGRLGRAHVDRFGLASEDERDPSGWIELDHLARGGVDRPHVVRGINAEADGGVEAVDILSELAHELSGAVEFKQPRSAVREGPIVAERGV